MWVGKLKAFQNTLVRCYSRKAAVNARKINPKVPTQQAYSIAQSLYDIIKQNGPLTVSNTWIHAKDAAIDGLNSKTHMKIMLKWMRGRKLLKLHCNQVGSMKKFLHSTVPEEEPQPQTAADSNSQHNPIPIQQKEGKKKRAS